VRQGGLVFIPHSEFRTPHYSRYLIRLFTATLTDW